MNDPKMTPENEDLLPEDQAPEAPADDTRDAEIADLKDRLLRQAAETENVRRRLDRRRRDRCRRYARPCG